MAEQEDLNQFNNLDSAGGVAVIGIVPVVMNFIFVDQDVVTAGMYGAGVCVLAFIAYLLASWTSARIVSKVVNITGWVAVVVYTVIAIQFFSEDAEKKFNPELEPAQSEQVEAETPAE